MGSVTQTRLLRRLCTYFCLIVCLSFVCSSSSAHGQDQDTDKTPIGTPTHHPKATAAIQNAMSALGSEAVLAGMSDSAMTADCEKKSQGKTEAHKLRWITSGEYFRIDTGEGDEKGAFKGPHERSVMINGKAVPLSDRDLRAFRQYHNPLALLHADMKAEKTKIEILPDEVIDGRPTTRVRITDIKASEGSAEPVNDEWFFDKSTHLPVRVTYLVQGVGSFRRFVQATVDYSDFQNNSASGIAIPMTFRRSYQGGLSTTCKLSSFTVNQKPSEHTFIRNGGSN